MHYTSRLTVPVHIIVEVLLIGDALALYHYPRDPTTIKPCARRKNTMRYHGEDWGPVCEWDVPSGSYTDVSITNCVEILRAECPEFNKGSCEMYNGLHCCKLRYKALKKTWIEVFYTNQYEPKYKISVVIEIHRNISDEYLENFGNTTQKDYPVNALDPNGERGLRFVEVKEPKKPLFQINTPMCEDLLKGDIRCGDSDRSETSYKYLKNNYAEGFDLENNRIPRTQYENDTQARVIITYESRCRDALVNSTRVPSCATFYRRNGLPADNTSAITSFIFMETRMVVETNGTFRLWYAYWSLEDPATRDIIFKDKNRYMGDVPGEQLV